MLASHSPAGTRAARTSHSMAYAMAMAATPSLGSELDSATARNR